MIIPKTSRFVAALFFGFFLTSSALSQTTQYDRATPPQHATGISSLGSYVSSDLGTVNLSNGALNMKIPIGSVGGRGFSMPITLNYSSKVWSASTDTDTNQQGESQLKLEFVGPGAIVEDDGSRAEIGRATRSGATTPAATGYFKGQLTIKMLDWSKKDIGYLPGSVMNDGKDNMLTPSVMLGHELGHARARMTGYRDKRGTREAIDGSLRLENKIRKLQFPNGPTRKAH